MVARSLTSGVSGMVNQQLVLDTAANNLANLASPGFKGSRVSFANALVQTSFNGSAPGAALGGRNPQQAGLGVATSSIDVNMGQGSLESTGRTFDLALQGEGFFQLSNGAKTLYSRVGNFDFDADNAIVDVGTGLHLLGNIYDPNADAAGNQALSQFGVPLVIDKGEAFPPKNTETITFQGNLSSVTPALTVASGKALTSVYPLESTLTGKVATETTPLSELNIFKGAQPASPDLDIFVYGTKPNGEAYAGTFTIRPGDVPSTANGGSGSVGDLLTKMNAVLAQGNERFGKVSLVNGAIISTSVGAGDGFSMFFGELSPIPTTANIATLTDAVGVGFNAVAATIDNHTIAANETGLLNPTFTIPAVDYTTAPDQSGKTLVVSIKVNGTEKGTITIPAADYTAVGAVRDFGLSSLPHVKEDDVVTYDISGAFDMTLNNAADLTWSTDVVNDSAATNLTADLDADNIPDMFQDGTPIDPNAWQYRAATNSTFNWYRARTVPETKGSTIEVFDAQGGRHSIDATFFRTGSRLDPTTGERINSWDVIVKADPTEGTTVSDVIGGIEFDQAGRVTGSVGITSHGTAFDGTNFVGNPSTPNIQIDWLTTGPSDPPTMRLDFGTPKTFTGLTGFGSSSTAAAVSQDGFADGKLDSLSVSQNGDISGLYTNGVSRKLAQIDLVIFRNPSGLTSVGANMFQESSNSGTSLKKTAGDGAATISSGALEGSNVDIATEFTRIITAQRGFQANAKVITTTDQVLETLINIIR